MNKRFGYGLITKHVALDPEITTDAKAVYMVLCSMADKNGVCNPLVKTIRACTDLSEYRFYNAMKNLRAKGIVTSVQSKEGTTFARNTYLLLDRPCLKISGTETEADNLIDLGTGSTNSTQTPRTLIASDAIPSYPTDLGIKQYQCLNSTNDIKSTNSKNIYEHVCDLLNHAKAQVHSKGRLKPNTYIIDQLRDLGMSDNSIIQAAESLVDRGRDVDWFSLRDYCEAMGCIPRIDRKRR